MRSIQRIIRAALFAKGRHWGLPLLLKGPPASGKTAIAEAAANASGLYSYRCAPSERGEAQFGVVPVPRDNVLTYPAPDWAAKVDAQPSCLFIDEMDSVPPQQQAPLLGMLQLRLIGSHQFHPYTRVVAAANGVSGTWDLREDLRLRMCHLDITGMDASEWVPGLLSGFDTPLASPGAALTHQRFVEEQWPARRAQAYGLVAGFITRRPELLRQRPESGSALVYPTQRTCENAAIALTTALVHDLNEAEADVLMAGFVGMGWVREFRAWAHFDDLPDAADLLDEKDKFTHDQGRIDRTIVMLSACVARVLPGDAPHRNERARVLYDIMNEIADHAVDVVAPVMTMMVSANPRIGITVAAGDTYKSYQRVAAKVLPVLSAQ